MERGEIEVGELEREEAGGSSQEERETEFLVETAAHEAI